MIVELIVDLLSAIFTLKSQRPFIFWLPIYSSFQGHIPVGLDYKVLNLFGGDYIHLYVHSSTAESTIYRVSILTCSHLILMWPVSLGFSTTLTNWFVCLHIKALRSMRFLVRSSVLFFHQEALIVPMSINLLINLFWLISTIPPNLIEETFYRYLPN